MALQSLTPVRKPLNPLVDLKNPFESLRAGHVQIYSRFNLKVVMKFQPESLKCIYQPGNLGRNNQEGILGCLGSGS